MDETPTSQFSGGPKTGRMGAAHWCAIGSLATPPRWQRRSTIRSETASKALMNDFDRSRLTTNFGPSGAIILVAEQAPCTLGQL
jgi:hypothetical protein